MKPITTPYAATLPEVSLSAYILSYIIREYDVNETANKNYVFRNTITDERGIIMKKSIKALAVATAIAVVMGMGTVYAAEAPVFEKTDRFYIMEDNEGDALLSSDGELVILIADDTPIIFEDDIDVRERLIEGETIIEFLNGRNLIVSYSITAHSIPPQTTPEKIVVLYEEIMPLLPGADIETDVESDIETDNLIDDLDQQEIEQTLIILNGEVVVNGEIIEAPVPYIKDTNVVMVPLRAIAEKLGFYVSWDAETFGIGIGEAISLQIGVDEYVINNMPPISLGTAPELTDSITFVPMEFFRNILPMGSVYAFEGQIVVEETGSDME